jgi:hypothetical protein
MTGHRLEVADVVRAHEDDYLAAQGATAAQRQVLRAIRNCRTATLGGHVEGCDHCGHLRIAYNSCRNRHCPKCQGPATARWLQARAAELLPVPYFHLVFTLPAALGPLILQNPRLLYGLLMQAVAETLLQVAADPRHLGAEIGFLAVLHTWGQNLMHHPHVHCVIPAGGIADNGQQWIACRKDFFLPVRVLSRVFRGKFIGGLKRAHLRGELTFHGGLAKLAESRDFEQLLDQVVRHEWVVYAKRPFGNPAAVLKYLARYTHRVAISNQRLVALKDGEVSFRWKDYAHGGRERLMKLSAVEFLRRFLLHVLPRAFVKIRHYGFLANRARTTKLELCRRLLHVEDPGSQIDLATSDVTAPDAFSETSSLPQPCPQCHMGRMRIIYHLEPQRAQPRQDLAYHDSS